jgi:diguanylate cyclase (GGDEF)-like protein
VGDGLTTPQSGQNVYACDPAPGAPGAVHVSFDLTNKARTMVKHVVDSRQAELEGLRQENAALRQGATHDHLTGLPNRRLLDDRLTQALARLERHGRPLTVFYVDLNRFKAVNDRFGHAVGDQVLIETGRRIRSVLRPADTAARVGGDEFVLVCESMGPALAGSVVSRLSLAFGEPMMIDDREVAVGLSIGMAATDSAHANASGLIAEADQDMYRAKRTEASIDGK